MLRRGAAAAADDVDQPFGGKLAQQTGGHLRRLVKTGLAHRIRQAGVRVTTDEGVACHPAQLLDVGTHQGRAQRAVEAHRQRPGVADAVPESGDGLPAQDAARSIGHGAADDQRQALARIVEILVDRKQRGLGVECVKNGFKSIRRCKR